MMIGRLKAGNLLIESRRFLFSKFKKASKKVEDFKKDDSFHHEYSIRPDTFAFKVSAKNENSRSLTTKKPRNEADEGSEEHLIGRHPLQKDVASSKPGFNVVDFVYRNATNYPFAAKTPQEVFNSFPLINSKRLSLRKARPRKVKMLTSDFIEDSLYNPHYGYFSREVEIFHQDKPFDYNNIEDVDDFMDHWEKAYAKYEDPKVENVKKQNAERSNKGSATKAAANYVASEAIAREKAAAANTKSKFARKAHQIQEKDLIKTGQFQKTKNSVQLWHTPTELFNPYYGEAMARYLLVNYKLKGDYPYHDLIIYEMGGGNGTLMCNILNYIKVNEPDVYARTKYKIIEISDQLATKQFNNAISAKLILQGLDTLKIEIINKSIFHWDTIVSEPCFFIALEVFDNFLHDLIRYDNTTGEPYQGHVLIDEHGDFYEFFTPELSAYANAYLQMRESGQHLVLQSSTSSSGRLQTLKSLVPILTDKDSVHPLLHSSLKLRWKNALLPFKDNLTPGEFIPTRLLEFFHILKHKFPQHHLLCLDFHYLPKAIPGYYNGPVVQTVLEDTMVDVTTYMCLQGYFDIMFPTDFQLSSELYKQVTGKVARVELHREFLEEWSEVEMTETKKGENPMLDFYENVSFMSL